MKTRITFLLWLASFTLFAQTKEFSKGVPSKEKSPLTKSAKVKATIDQYKIITPTLDTTFVDTSLTIKKEYEYNYLHKDNFGLLPFANEGQTYNTLQFGLNTFTMFPEFGYKAKHFNYLEANQINYYSVATPLTELYFKTVMEQGQNLDAFLTLNTSKQLNFSVAYKGLRSLGKYINQLSSTGNFRFTTSYTSKNKRYLINAHFTAQDIYNGENGGITTIDDFESEDPAFTERARLNVYLKDAKSFLKGKRVFFDQYFRINAQDHSNNLYVAHQFNVENKFFEYNQATLPTTITSSTGEVTSFNRFGDSYVTSNINNQVRYNKMYNKLGAIYENKTLGRFQFYVDEFRYNYFYNSVLYLATQTVPNSLNETLHTVGGQYEYRKNKWNGQFIYASSIGNEDVLNLNANLNYALDAKNRFSFQYQKVHKLPNLNYNLHQSSYVNYNWFNDFKNEKINSIKFVAQTQWLVAELQLNTLNDYLYFSNDDQANLQLITPKQFDQTINYLSAKVSKEFKFRKFALDNTLLYQKVDQSNLILNVPQFVTRNTLYYSDYFFNKALYLQTGVIFNYFSSYYANDYNPILGEFFVQEQKKIGAFSMVDFFVNAKVQQARIYLKAEHFNSSFTGNTFYSAPNNPYRDFIIRFGIIWNFFQ
jgi:hypothetical protein